MSLFDLPKDVLIQNFFHFVDVNWLASTYNKISKVWDDFIKETLKCKREQGDLYFCSKPDVVSSLIWPNEEEKCRVFELWSSFWFLTKVKHDPTNQQKWFTTPMAAKASETTPIKLKHSTSGWYFRELMAFHSQPKWELTQSSMLRRSPNAKNCYWMEIEIVVNQTKNLHTVMDVRFSIGNYRLGTSLTPWGDTWVCELIGSMHNGFAAIFYLFNEIDQTKYPPVYYGSHDWRPPVEHPTWESITDTQITKYFESAETLKIHLTSIFLYFLSKIKEASAIPNWYWTERELIDPDRAWLSDKVKVYNYSAEEIRNKCLEGYTWNLKELNLINTYYESFYKLLQNIIIDRDLLVKFVGFPDSIPNRDLDEIYGSDDIEEKIRKEIIDVKDLPQIMTDTNEPSSDIKENRKTKNNKCIIA